MTDFNVSLLSDIVNWAVQDELDLQKTHPEWGSWDQSQWAKEVRNGVCQTAYCIAGQAVAQDGEYGLVLDCMGTDSDGRKVYTADYCAPMEVVGTDAKGKPIRRVSDFGHVSIERRAIALLGLDTGEDALFNGENSITHVVSIASYFARVRGLSLNLIPEAARFDVNITADDWEHFIDCGCDLRVSDCHYA